MIVAHTHRIYRRRAIDQTAGPIHTHPVVDGVPHPAYIDADHTWHIHRASEISLNRTGPAIAIIGLKDYADAG